MAIIGRKFRSCSNSGMIGAWDFLAEKSGREFLAWGRKPLPANEMAWISCLHTSTIFYA